jgi:S-DNA-T family DNA segregation ATPase FtsK/SpoIIIE
VGASIAHAVVRWAGPVLPAPPAERLTLPTPPAPASRPSFPLIATLAPVVVSLALWLLTQSIYSLLFALLGPVVAVGGLVDGRVGRRRNVRRERARYLAALDRTATTIAAAQDRERARLERLAAGSTGWGEVTGGPVAVGVGRGTIAGGVELSGDEPDDVADGALSRRHDRGSAEITTALRTVRAAAAELPDAHIVVDARDGIGVIGPPVLTTAIARAIALRVAARMSPVAAVITAPSAETWTEHLPHAVVAGDPTRYDLRDGDHEPIVISWAENEPDLAIGCGILISAGPVGGVSGAGIAESPRDLVPDALTRADAASAAMSLRSRAEARGLRPAGERIPAHVALAELLPLVPPSEVQGSLSAPIGCDADGPVVVDLVAQGPHAVIAGTTGSGKSELLISWILGIAAGRSPDEVTFLLVDFKGGSAFAPLAVLPHVVATLSDLDTRTTNRAIESLRAELRHRERVLADAGARSIDDLPRGALARLVVVDEFAAVVAASPELHDVFADLAARGRSLGLHLILCTQRPAGVIRDAVLANTTLRFSLRVTDRADSVAMLGTDAAARLPAEPRGRGILLHDGTARTVQLAIADAADAGRVAERAPRARVVRPWCEPLPSVLPLDSLPPVDRGIAFGLLDLPAEQRQPVAIHDPERHGHLLVLGGAGGGSSTALQTLSVSAVRAGMRVRIVPSEPADAWAVLSEAAERSGPERTDEGAVLVIDDLDVLVARFDDDYRHEFLALLTGLIRRNATVGPMLAVAAHRLTGAVAGLAGMFGSRLLLRQTSREEHVLAGGDPRGFDPDLPPGAGTWRGSVVQVAVVHVAVASDIERPELPAGLEVAAPAPYQVIPADHPVLAIVAGRPRAHLERLRATGARVIELGGAAVPPPTELVATPTSGTTIVLGDPEAWLADWSMLATARRDWPIVLIDATPADHRALLRDRVLPPPLGPAHGECWLAADGRTRRATLVLTDSARDSEENPTRNR